MTGDGTSAGRWPARLGEWTKETFAGALADGPLVVLVPVGSVEPHGPHLPLATDTLISEAAALAAIERLRARGVTCVMAPTIPFGVTDFAAGFAGAITVAAGALSGYVRAVVDGLLAAGAAHACLVNNHLEPAHDAAVRAAIVGLPPFAASVVCPLDRRVGRALTDEFKRGECHAGRYETSIVMAHAPALVDEERRRALPERAVSLSRGIAAGARTFAELGMADAYAGAPAAATADEGRASIARLAEAIEAAVTGALASRTP